MGRKSRSERLPRFRRVAGEPLLVNVEHGNEPLRVDHVWITIEAGSDGPIRLAVNTRSLRNELAGFDPRIRAGYFREMWQTLPATGVFPATGLDYAAIESAHNIFYEFFEQRDLELLLIEKSNAAILIEAWGELYQRDHNGLHQIHCRRASCAVPEDLAGHDGALKFYYDRDNTSELLLFKFCGQP